MDFQANLAAQAQTTYHLRTGGANPAPPQPLRGSQNAQTITVDTGAARFVIDKANFDLWRQVYLDRDGDGAVDDPLLVEGVDAGPTVTAAGDTYRSRRGALQEIVIEHNGPLHAVIRVEGWHADAGGSRLLAFTARLHCYAGQSAVRAFYGAWNDNPLVNDGTGQPAIKALGSPNTILFDDLSLRLALDGAGPLRYTLGGAPGQWWTGVLTGAASVYQDSSGGPQWHHDPDNLTTTFRGFQAAANGAELHAACSEAADSADCRAQGWADLAATDGGVAVGLRHFWQNYWF